MGLSLMKKPVLSSMLKLVPTRFAIAALALLSLAACTNMGGAIGFGIPIGPYGNIGLSVGSNGAVGVSAGVGNGNVSANIGTYGILQGTQPATQTPTTQSAPVQPVIQTAPVR